MSSVSKSYLALRLNEANIKSDVVSNELITLNEAEKLVLYILP